MRTFRTIRWISMCAALLVALGALWFVRASRAQEPVVYVLAQDQRACGNTGQQVPAVRQDEALGLGLQGFFGDEPVEIALIFPDGRVYSPIVASKLMPDLEGGLDGLQDLPDDPGYIVLTDAGGDYYESLMPNQKWPYGCYSISALGVVSGFQASTSFVIKDELTTELTPNAASLRALDRDTRSAFGLQGSEISLFGRGFQSQERVQLLLRKPDGAQRIITTATTSDVGAFQAQVSLGREYPAGQYAFIAIGADSSISQTFTLRAAKITARGWGDLRIAKPYTGRLKQNESFEVQGKQFDANEPVALKLVLPNGATRDLRTVASNNIGTFAVELPVSHQLPVGEHQILAIGLRSGSVVTEPLVLMRGPSSVLGQVVNPNGVAPIPAATDTPAMTEPTVAVSTTPEPTVTATSAVAPTSPITDKAPDEGK